MMFSPLIAKLKDKVEDELVLLAPTITSKPGQDEEVLLPSSSEPDPFPSNLGPIVHSFPPLCIQTMRNHFKYIIHPISELLWWCWWVVVNILSSS